MKTFTTLVAALAFGLGAAALSPVQAQDAMMKKDTMMKHGGMMKTSGMKKHHGGLVKGNTMEKDAPAK